jgi:hypothetical protein
MPMPTLLLLIPGGRETDPPVVGVQVTQQRLLLVVVVVYARGGERLLDLPQYILDNLLPWPAIVDAVRPPTLHPSLSLALSVLPQRCDPCAGAPSAVFVVVPVAVIVVILVHPASS